MNFRMFLISLFLLLFPAPIFAQTDCDRGGTAVGKVTMSGTVNRDTTINWSQTGDFYFSVRNAPPNVCGALATIRNGSCLYTPNWICTDENGSVDSRHWTWSDQTINQTDKNIHIDWSDGTTTSFPYGHIWDKTCPASQITSNLPSGQAPTTWEGTETDNQWGAGLDYGWTEVTAWFWDVTTNKFWNPSTKQYDSSSIIILTATLSTMPSHAINWSFPDIPKIHTSGDQYNWNVTFRDGDTRCGVNRGWGFRPI
jgi:hypothetical protein